MTRIIAIMVVSTVLGCSGSDRRNDADALVIGDIAAIDWQLARMQLGAEDIKPIKSSLVVFRCTPDGEVAGSASINRYSGSMVTEGSRILRWNPMRVTRMAGPPELMKQESFFLEAISKTTRMARFGRNLILENASEGVRLEFIKRSN